MPEPFTLYKSGAGYNCNPNDTGGPSIPAAKPSLHRAVAAVWAKNDRSVLAAAAIDTRHHP